MSKAFSIFFLTIAIIAALAASFLPASGLASFSHVVRFFEIMIPFLGVGALFKYLLSE